MATNVAYFWTQRTAPDLLNNLIQTGSQREPAIAGSQDGTHYFGTWTDLQASFDVQGRLADSTGIPLGDQFLVNSTVDGDQFDSSIAALSNSTWVVTFTDRSADPGGDIRFRLFDSDGTPLGDDVAAIASPEFDDDRSDVAATADGGFVVAFHRDFGGGDLDVLVQRYNADGTENGGRIIVDESTALNTQTPSIAGLASGGFVVAWDQLPVGGGVPSVWFQRYDAAGAPIGDHVRIDQGSEFLSDIQVAALDDGGFVVAYRDDSWRLNGTEITLQFFNADGSPRTGSILVNDITDGFQLAPSLTVLSNGFVVVSWVSNAVLRQQAYDAGGNRVGDNYVVEQLSVTNEAEIAALTSGLVAEIHSTAVSFDIVHSIHELIRTVTGDAAADTLAGDSLRDTLLGSGGADLLIPGGGNDTVDGGTGLDTLSYEDATQSVIVDLPYDIALGAEIGTDTVTNIENVITGGGNDAVAADGATNVLDGRAGSDMVSYYTASGVIIDLSANVGVDASSLDVLLNFENANGSGFNDAISATAAANVLNGLGGNDTVSYYMAAGPVTIDLAADTGIDPTSVDTLLSIENANGSSFGDVIIGDGGNNILNGLGGGDALTGNGGLDSFVERVGEANGDVVSDFDGAGAAAGDTFVFVGFGTTAQGASFTQLNATQWQIHSGLDGHNEIITLGNSAAVHTSDVLFV
jgi:hypothetical protein